MRTSYKVLISGLDSGVLNEDTRSFSAMVPALKELRERELPLVLCASKTPGETLRIQKRLGIPDPFIVETGLSLEAAEPAQQGECDELFKGSLHTSTVLQQIKKTLKGSELSVTKGGKYFHLKGGSNAGQADVLLRKLYKECHGPVSLGGTGDGATDLLMLEKVDCPMIVAKANGKHHQRPPQRLPHARKVHGVGPGEWTEAVSGMLEESDQPHER